MKHIRYFIAAILLVLVPQARGEDAIRVTALTDHLYLLTTDQGTYTTNSMALVGDDGVLLVDTQSEEYAEELKKVVLGFGKGAPKIIINTHRHVEHVGGNAIFGGDPIVIAHGLVRTKLRQGSYLFDEFPDITLPDITLTDRLCIYFDGEKLELTAIPGSHDDNEVIVHFTKSKIVHLSSLVNGFNFPSIDSDGSVLAFPACVQKAMDLLPADVTIVSGHNPPGKYSQLRPYHDMLVASIDAVREGIAAGKDAEALKAEKVLEPWKAYAGSYVSVDDWIDYIVEGLKEKPAAKKKIHDPLYHALKEQGVDAAIALYLKLKRDAGSEYEFEPTDLLSIGAKLIDKKKTPEGIAMLELNVKEYPDHKYAYYDQYQLAVAYQSLGKIDRAISYCEKALSLRPESKAIAKLLEDLKKPRAEAPQVK